MEDQQDVNVQDNKAEGQPESEVHTEAKPAEEVQSSERTREQFEKLTQKNKEMAEKLSAYEAKERAKSVLESLKPQPEEKQVPQVQVPNNMFPPFQWQQPEPKLVDDNGFVDGSMLELQLKEARMKAEKAEKEAQEIRKQFVNYEETQQVREAHTKYPELDPSSEKFDETFYGLVRNELLGQMATGKKDVLAAAAAARKIYQPKVVEKKPTETVTEDQTSEKQQINAGSRKASSKFADMDDAKLAELTRRGDKTALAERLKRAGY